MENVGQANFFHQFREKKLPPELLESWQGLVFQESLMGTVSQSIISINFGG